MRFSTCRTLGEGPKFMKKVKGGVISDVYEKVHKRY